MAWTKAKTAVLVGVGILLVSGTAIVAVKTPRPEPDLTEKILDSYAQVFAQADENGWTADDEAFHDAIVQVMTNYPPAASIRLSPTQRQPPLPGQRRLGGYGTAQGRVEMRAFLGQVVRYAYDLDPRISQNRIIVPSDLAATHFDFVDTMPRNGREALQRVLKEKFGIVGKWELRPNLALTMKNSVAGLHKHTDAANADGFRVVNETMAHMASGLGRYMGVKVTDKTGLAGGFDYTLNVPNPASPTPEEIRKALLDQLGLELIPADDGQQTEFFVVEYAQ